MGLNHSPQLNQGALAPRCWWPELMVLHGLVPLRGLTTCARLLRCTLGARTAVEREPHPPNHQSFDRYHCWCTQMAFRSPRWLVDVSNHCFVIHVCFYCLSVRWVFETSCASSANEGNLECPINATFIWSRCTHISESHTHTGLRDIGCVLTNVAVECRIRKMRVKLLSPQSQSWWSVMMAMDSLTRIIIRQKGMRCFLASNSRWITPSYHMFGGNDKIGTIRECVPIASPIYASTATTILILWWMVSLWSLLSCFSLSTFGTSHVVATISIYAPKQNVSLDRWITTTLKAYPRSWIVI